MGLTDKPRVAVVGATGAVGRVMLEILHERSFPAAEVVALASARSEGLQVHLGEASLKVGVLDEKNLQGSDLVLLDAPDEVALEWAPKAVEAGAVVVDNSAAWRMEPDVPLVVPEVNPLAAGVHRGIIASPNCTTIAVVVPVAALHHQFGLAKMVVSSYQATSGAGQGGVDELLEQTQALAGAASRGEEWKGRASAVFPAGIAGNIIPRIGSEKEAGFTSEELKMLHESRKIMDLPGLDVVCTCVRVPTAVGHGASVYAEFEHPVDLELARKALQEAPGVKMTALPNPLDAAGTDPCYVGRLRPDPSNPNALAFFTVSDNLRKGAALNTVQIAELLLK